jgi:hypothetical protein
LIRSPPLLWRERIEVRGIRTIITLIPAFPLKGEGDFQTSRSGAAALEIVWASMDDPITVASSRFKAQELGTC